MRKILLLSVMGLTITACQAPQQDTAKIDKLEADVAEIKADLYGKGLGSCDAADKILAGPADYAASLEGMPEASVEGADWHKANGERENVMSTPSGLQYTVVQEGIGDLIPRPTDIVRVNYHGFFKDGEKFDSSYDRGEDIEFPANGVIKGWIEALTAMKPCEARTLYIPGDLAYGPKGRGGIPPNATLIFNVQLLGITEKKGLIK